MDLSIRVKSHGVPFHILQIVDSSDVYLPGTIRICRVSQLVPIASGSITDISVADMSAIIGINPERTVPIPPCSCVDYSDTPSTIDMCRESYARTGNSRIVMIDFTESNSRIIV